MKNIDFSVLVHAQPRFSYTKHSGIGNIRKHVPPEDSLQLVAENYGEPLFDTKYKFPSDNEGYFNPENLTKMLEDMNLDQDSPHQFNITLVGGGLNLCVSRAFRVISHWRSKTHFLNRTRLILPHDGVFEYSPKSGASFTLGEILKEDNSPEKMDFMINYCPSFYGRITLDDGKVVFDFLRRPWGVFLKSGKCIILRDQDLYAMEG